MPSEPKPGELPPGTRVSVTIEIEGVIHGYGHSIRANQGRFVALDMPGGTRTFVQLDRVASLLPIPSDGNGSLNGHAGASR